MPPQRPFLPAAPISNQWTLYHVKILERPGTVRPAALWIVLLGDLSSWNTLLEVIMADYLWIFLLAFLDLIFCYLFCYIAKQYKIINHLRTLSVKTALFKLQNCTLICFPFLFWKMMQNSLSIPHLVSLNHLSLCHRNIMLPFLHVVALIRHLVKTQHILWSFIIKAWLILYVFVVRWIINIKTSCVSSRRKCAFILREV